MYVWGKYGVADKEFIPLKIKGLKACTQLWCLNRAVFASLAGMHSGRDERTSVVHSLEPLDSLADNTLYSWGASGGTPMLGHGDVKDRNTPKRIDNMERCSISNIASGTAHTICCTGTVAHRWCVCVSQLALSLAHTHLANPLAFNLQPKGICTAGATVAMGRWETRAWLTCCVRCASRASTPHVRLHAVSERLMSSLVRGQLAWWPPTLLSTQVLDV